VEVSDNLSDALEIVKMTSSRVRRFVKDDAETLVVMDEVEAHEAASDVVPPATRRAGELLKREAINDPLVPTTVTDVPPVVAALVTIKEEKAAGVS